LEAKAPIAARRKPCTAALPGRRGAFVSYVARIACSALVFSI